MSSKFKPGDAKPENSGRKPGTLNKKNQEIQDLAKELDCNPAKILMLIAMGDSKALDSLEHIDMDQRKDAAKDLMPYLYGKRKPVDSNGDDSTDFMAEILNAIDARK